MQKKGIWEPVLWLVSMVASHLIPRSLLRFTATKIMEHPSTPSKFFPKHLTTILLYFLLQLVPESPRFYMAAGKPEKALCILQKIAKENNKELPPGELIATEQHEVLIWILKSLSWTWQNFKNQNCYFRSELLFSCLFNQCIRRSLLQYFCFQLRSQTNVTYTPFEESVFLET